jgi:hypothetical protein
MKLDIKRFAVLFLFASLTGLIFAQAPENAGALRGQVTDPSGAVVIGAAITVTAGDGSTHKISSDKQGNYIIRGLPAGTAKVSAAATGFSPYKMMDVIIVAGQAHELDISLGIAVKQEQVTVESKTTTLDVNPANNTSSTVLRGQDLDALSDDPDELEQDLLALAGPSAGPNGGQIYIDSFSDGTLPPKSAIREVRINQNPFSAQYDRPGSGRVEVFTRPGSDKWHGQVMFNENNSIFNSRNPYVLTSIPPYHSERYSGNVSGAFRKKGSVFFNAECRDINETAAVDATGLGPNGMANDPTPITQAPLVPQTRTNVSGRADWQLAPSNTLTVRYQFLKDDEQNQGIGGIVLTERGYITAETQQQVQLSDTQVLSSRLINETRFQFIRDDNTQSANQKGAAINVLGEFSGGGSTVAESSDRINRYELQNHTSSSVGRHFMKFGGRLRISQDSNNSSTNFNGTLTYGSLASYANGTPSQLSIVSGSPRAQLIFADVGLYAEDDWKLRPNLTLSYGLRFESQSSISDKADFAPRLGLSWGLGSAKSAPKTVLRLGYGIFYDRFPQDLVLQAQRVNGIIETQTISSATTANPITCPAGTNPTQPINASQCTFSGGSSPTLYQINPNLQASYTMQTAVSLERQLKSVGTISFTYVNSRGLHQFIMENVNAPLPGQGDDTRPLIHTRYTTDNIYQYNSEAIFKQNQLITNAQLRVLQKVSLTGFYTFGYANSNTSGASSSPSNQYDLHQDYGRAPFDIRHRLFVSGTLSLAHNIRISPYIVANSGAPYNITTGQDNGDTFYNERPAFVTSSTSSSDVILHGFDVTQATAVAHPIPIYYGNGPANFTFNLRLSKTFGLGPDMRKGTQAQDQGGTSSGSSFGVPRGMGGMFGPSNTTRRYNLTITAMARNLLNTWNPGTPIGNLASTMFGKSNSLASGPHSTGTANRRIDLQAIFSF